MKKIIGLFLLVLTFSTSFSQLKIPQNSTLAMYVESGGKGIKFGLLAYTDLKFRKFVVVESRELNIGLSAEIQTTGNINKRDIESATSGIYDTYTQLLEKYKQYGLITENVFFYTSSGLGVAKNINDYCTIVGQKVSHNLYVVKENEEAKYTIAGTIPYEVIDFAITLDQGGSNTKGGYVIKDGNMLTAVPVVFDLGSVRVAELVKSYMRTQPDDEAEFRNEFIYATNKCFDSLKIVIRRVLENVEGAEDRSQLYLSGGAAYVISTLLNPEYNPNEQIVPLDINQLRAFVNNIQDVNYYNTIKERTFTNEAVAKDYKKALKVYNHIQLISASKLLITYVNGLGGNGKKLYFNRYGLHAMPSILMGRVLRGELKRW
jgi:hypothetical protein